MSTTRTEPRYPCAVALVGEYDAHFEPHAVTVRELRKASPDVAFEWIPPSRLQQAPPEHTLARFDGLVAAPGFPQEGFDGALSAIRYGRETRRPLLGICAGFQLIAIEHARHVLGLTEADTEARGACLDPMVTALPCSLAGRVLPARFEAGSRVARAYGALEARERYYCAFGLNPAYRRRLEETGLRVTGFDPEGEARALEATDGHPFFVGTLFVPSLESEHEAHPLVTAFVQQASARRLAQERCA